MAEGQGSEGMTEERKPKVGEYVYEIGRGRPKGIRIVRFGSHNSKLEDERWGITARDKSIQLYSFHASLSDAKEGAEDALRVLTSARGGSAPK